MTNTVLHYYLRLANIEMERIIKQEQNLDDDERNEISSYIQEVWVSSDYYPKIDPEHQTYLEELRLEAAEDYYGILNNPEIDDDLDLDQQIQQCEQ